MSVPQDAAATPVAPDDGIVRLLRLLARRHAAAVLNANGDVTIAAPGRAPAVVPATVLESACASGWAAVSGNSVGMTRTGRATLRRILSRTEVREASSKTVSARPPAPT